MLIQKSKTGDFYVYVNENRDMLTFQIQNSRASFQHRDLVSIYYFILKNIKFYLTKDVVTLSNPVKIKNAVFFSNVIDDEAKKRVEETKHINLNEIDKYYRVAAILINKDVINLNLASLFEIKRHIEDFFRKSDNFQIKFKEKEFNLTIEKNKNITELLFEFPGEQKERIKLSSDNIKVLIRNLKEKLIYDWKLYNVNLSNKFVIYQTRKPNTFIIKVNDRNIETGADVLIGISISV